MGAVLTGVVSYKDLNTAQPLAVAAEKMDSPIFLRIFASFDEEMQSVFCDSPRLISKNFIKFGDSSYFGIDFLKTKD